MNTETGAVQLGLFTANRAMFGLLLKLSRSIDCDTHMARLADVPQGVTDDDVQTNLRRLLREFKLPFAVVAITGTPDQIQHSAKVFMEARKKVRTLLIMCPDGSEYMHEVADLPCMAIENPPNSYRIVGSILLGQPEEFPVHDESRFGEPNFVPVDEWTEEGLPRLAEHIRRVAKPLPRVFVG